MGLDLKRVIRAVSMNDKIVTPRMERYYYSGEWDRPFTAAEAKPILDQLLGPMYNAKGSFRASASGTCQRYQELRFLGVNPGGATGTQLAAIFDDGKWRHLRWQAHLLRAGILTEIELALRWKRLNAIATMDGRGYVPDDHPKPEWQGKEFGFELKGSNQTVYYEQTKTQGQAKEAHLRQAHRAMLLGGMDLYVVLYENKNTQEWYEWVIEPDPVMLDESLIELEQMNLDLERGSLAPMLDECKAHKGDTFRNCPMGTKTGPCPRAGSKLPTPAQVRRLSVQ